MRTLGAHKWPRRTAAPSLRCRALSPSLSERRSCASSGKWRQRKRCSPKSSASSQPLVVHVVGSAAAERTLCRAPPPTVRISNIPNKGDGAVPSRLLLLPLLFLQQMAVLRRISVGLPLIGTQTAPAPKQERRFLKSSHRRGKGASRPRGHRPMPLRRRPEPAGYCRRGSRSSPLPLPLHLPILSPVVMVVMRRRRRRGALWN